MFLGYKKWSESAFLGYEKWSDSAFLGYNYYENLLVFLCFLPGFWVIWKTKYTVLLSECPSKTYVKTDFGDGIPLSWIRLALFRGHLTLFLMLFRSNSAIFGCYIDWKLLCCGWGWGRIVTIDKTLFWPAGAKQSQAQPQLAKVDQKFWLVFYCNIC